MLRDITEFNVHGWPETDAGLPEDLQIYYCLRDKLAYHVGFVVKGNRVTVPEETILQRVHGAHLGMSKMKVLAQESLLAYDAWIHIILCTKMQSVPGGKSKVQPIEPMQQHLIPGQPWPKMD